MPNNTINDLLKPSLADTKSISKSYSVTAHMLVAWFGGPLGAALFSIINLQQMGIAKRHTKVCISLFCLSLLFSLLPVLIALEQIPLPEALVLGDIKGTSKIAIRLFGVLIYALFYICFKKYYIASNQIPSDPPSSWKAGIACALTGGLVTFASILLIGITVTT